MPIQILMPALSPTMTEGNLARWLKKEGDEVKAGQVIAEIETDKATMEVEAVDEGKILKILIPGGAQGIKVNTPIAVLTEEGEEGMTAEAAMAALAKKKGAATPSEAPSPVAAKTETPKASPTLSPPMTSDTRVIASPLARRIAEQSGLDLRSVRGSGPNGRIVKDDVEGAVPQRASSASAPAPTTVAAPTPSRVEAPRYEPRATPTSSSSAPLATGMDARDYAEKLGMAYEAIPNSGVRKVIARRLTESKQTVPHFYLRIDCEIDELLTLRKHLNEVSGTKISVNDCIIRAVALAMKKVPAANASWTNEAILQYKNIDVSVAVATANGLVTPIIKNVDHKSLVQISTEMKDLGLRAREGKLRPEEFQGGGFTISNLGMYGVREFSAIINPPQSCILAVGAGEQRPVVKNGQLAIATVMTCTLSVDHRSVDGSVGAEFLAAFKPLIEKSYSLVV